MRRALVFAAAPSVAQAEVAARHRADDFIVAADGGARHATHCGLTPHLVVGDFDSLDATELEALETRSAEIRRFPREKDQIDLELALDAVREHDIDDVLVFAALGGRADHTHANLSLMASPAYRGIRLTVVAEALAIHVLHGGDTLRLDGRRGQIVSLLPVLGHCSEVRTRGLAFPLVGERLYGGSSRGLSNRFTDDSAEISLGDGTLLCYHLLDTPE